MPGKHVGVNFYARIPSTNPISLRFEASSCFIWGPSKSISHASALIAFLGTCRQLSGRLINVLLCFNEQHGQNSPQSSQRKEERNGMSNENTPNIN